MWRDTRVRLAAAALAALALLTVLLVGPFIGYLEPVPEPVPSSVALGDCPPGSGDSCGSGQARSSQKPTVTPSSPRPSLVPGTKDPAGNPPLEGELGCIQQSEQPATWWNAPAAGPNLQPGMNVKVGPNAFGLPVPTYGGDADRVEARLYDRLCNQVKNLPTRQTYGPDQALLRALWATVNPEDPNAIYTRSEWEAVADTFVSQNIIWGSGKVVFREAPAKAKTLEMVGKQGSQTPRIRLTKASSRGVEPFLLIDAITADGRDIVTLTLRLACGFQPYFAPGKVPLNLQAAA